MMKEFLIVVTFIGLFALEEYRIFQRDIEIMNLKLDRPDSTQTVKFNCVKCNTENTRTIFWYSDTIEHDSTKIFKHIK